LSDIALVYKNNSFDIEIVDDDLLADDGLETAVSVSVFTDARAKENDDLKGKTNRGYWGDMYPEQDGDVFGSRYWLLMPAKVLPETANIASDYLKESLIWMVEDGIAASINVSSSYNENKFLISSIEINKKEGKSLKFSLLWDGQKIKREVENGV
jgi:phage gp46-like protein